MHCASLRRIIRACAPVSLTCAFVACHQRTLTPYELWAQSPIQYRSSVSDTVGASTVFVHVVDAHDGHDLNAAFIRLGAYGCRASTDAHGFVTCTNQPSGGQHLRVLAIAYTVHEANITVSASGGVSAFIALRRYPKELKAVITRFGLP